MSRLSAPRRLRFVIVDRIEDVLAKLYVWKAEEPRPRYERLDGQGADRWVGVPTTVSPSAAGNAHSR